VAEDRVVHLPLGVSDDAVERGEGEAVREALGILPEDGPGFLLAGDARRATRHDYGVWAGGIVQQLYPRVRVVVREDPRGRRDHGLERLLNSMADPEVPVAAPASIKWPQLLSIADVLLVTADGPVPMAGALHAMMMGVPVVGTPTAAVREIIEEGETGLIGRTLRARGLAARIEEVMGNEALRNRLIAGAREKALETHRLSAMVARLQSLYAMGGVSALAGV
jgi:glycosyltransferase involved in cell wall biosynthesis